MITYKHLTDTVLARIDEDGKSRTSCSVEDEEFKKWCALGNAPLPLEDPIPDYAEQIAALEAKELLPRAIRELMLKYAEAAYSPEELLLDISYQRIKNLDTQIRELRALM
jgi:hypothetical protein